MTQNTEAKSRGKTGKSDYVIKVHGHKVETNEKNIYNLYHRGLISPTHGRFLVFEKKKINNPIRTHARNISRQLTKPKAHMALKQMKC